MKTIFALMFMLSVVGCESNAARKAAPKDCCHNKEPEKEQAKPAPPLVQQKPLLIIFSATWCAPCKQLEAQTLKDAKVIESLANYNVHHVDIDADKKTAASYLVRAVPTYIVVKEGDVIKRGEGFREPNEFLKWLVP